MPVYYQDDRYTADLEEMIDRQLVSRGMHDSRILKAFRSIPRHLFMPRGAEEDAYADHPTQIACGQTISQPFIVALMIAYLDIRPESRVLEIGTGSGYSTALLAQLAQHVDSVEIHAELLAYAKKHLDQVPHQNITLYLGSGWEELPGNSYDRIVVWASPPAMPEKLLNNLKNGGRLVLPMGKMDQYVYIVRKRGDIIDRDRRDAVRFVPLVREEQVPRKYLEDTDQ